MRRIKPFVSWLLLACALLLSLATFGCGAKVSENTAPVTLQETTVAIEATTEATVEATTEVASAETAPIGVESGHTYTSKSEVAAYLHAFNELPPNFITKKEAEKLGWNSSEGNLWEVTDRQSIGGDRFGNREGLLPKADGRQYYECDINYSGGYRGGERIVFSNDGRVYYTGDHYKTFEQLYPER